MDWMEITISPKEGQLDRLCDRLVALGHGAFSVEDGEQFKQFLETNRQYWDYIDSDLEQSFEDMSRVKLYLEKDARLPARLEELSAGIADCGALSHSATVKDEDWENNWKAYYKPLEIGERLLICPEWEEPKNPDGRKVLRLDPGTIFGTGGHATTRLCLRALEGVVKGGEKVLDLGCGSGILSIAALLLGAGHACGVDIDPRGRDISAANAALSGFGPDKYEPVTGDVTTGKLKERFTAEKSHIVLANIVADVILNIAPVAPDLICEGGVFICSGIIGPRAAEVETALKKVFKSVEGKSEEDWWSFICR
ncbi:MAG: 50S ribosomal protein L11 methyltransferase [Oscillospiraceae bacterium]|nr:50S ribosomal protein L11 methyltransferase [Oscillospiraceae bacterium]